ncbi:pilus assembly protein [Marinobacter litoralis]|uniref:pilus assembly protein n=1 Tax=Marinobacter litoralis TaxID=187981 RepID=UPI0018ECB316|nr:PilC/PilY family type IV pilus protein [Marinobacter litoralis]MBJ6138653.1 hypothetical protein [Marinobacter litoralis]
MNNTKNVLRLMLAVIVGSISANANASGTGISAFADRPLYLAGGRGVPGNLVLTPSVEFPTLQSLANLGSYTRDKAFVGYFDSEKCYKYSYSSTESERHFYPSSIATSRACSGVNEWSGNFLNWVTTQTIDPFRKALTGGYRVKDTATETWLEKARHAGNSNVAERSISGVEAAKATPFTDTVHFKIQGMEKSLQFYLGSGGFKSRGASDLEDYDPNVPINTDDNYMAAVRVKVCDANVGLEPNCVQYGNNWKPEGLIQANVNSLNYSVFGYLNDNNVKRDGAVLRADQRDVSAEWDPQTGIIFDNPDNATEGNSGVINYINKFGQLNTNSHKSYDPVSELYYAATRYLKNQGNVAAYSSNPTEKHKDNFPVITNWTDPVSYECQPTAILGIGDANTHRDGNLPGSSYRSVDEPAIPSEVSADNTVNVTEMTNLIGVMEPGLDGTLGNGEFTGRRNTAYIAGLAYDNRINDMRPDLDGDQLATTHWVDVMENQKLECATRNQYYLATKYGGFTLPDDYDASRTDDLPESWWTNGDTLACANNGTMKRPKNFYTAGNAEKMVESLEEAFKNIVSDAEGTSTAVTFNTATIESDTLLFGAQFNSASWTGKLFATSIQRAASGPPKIANTYSWEAGAVLDQRDLVAEPRNIYTFNGTSGVEFTAGNLASLTQAMQDDLEFGGDSDLAEKRIRYLRGEAIDGMRSRISRLGDIVNSTPVYIEAPSMNWPESSAFGTDSGSHANFAKTYENRKGVIYVGGNDGMLHAFAADTGEELFAYIPEFIASDTAQEGLHYLTDPAYTHRYYVDLSPVVSEVKSQGAGGSAAAWRSVLIGGARTGGKGIFALDITDPNGFASGASNIPMWEFSAADDSRLGYITEPPTISLADWGGGSNKWTVFLPNGYMSDTPSTGFFMLDIEGGLDGTWSEGSDYKYIEFDSATDATGLSPIRQVDLEGSDRIVDRIYAGDLKGNLWVATLGNQGWGNPYRGPLFTATGGQSPQAVITTPQPITAAPLAIRYPETVSGNKGGGNSGSNSKVMVLFGTGKYLELGDVNNTDVQSFYGVFDNTAALDRSDLLDRTLSAGQVTVDGVDYDVRYSGGDAFDPTTHSGWYVDLIDSGERINLSAQVRGDYIFVNSLVPTTNPCDIGGEGWLMAFGLDGRTADRTIWPKLGKPVAGYKVEGGIPNQTSFIDDYALTPLSNSEILPDEIDVGASSAATGRRSWQELYD